MFVRTCLIVANCFLQYISWLYPIISQQSSSEESLSCVRSHAILALKMCENYTFHWPGHPDPGPFYRGHKCMLSYDQATVRSVQMNYWPATCSRHKTSSLPFCDKATSSAHTVKMRSLAETSFPNWVFLPLQRPYDNKKPLELISPLTCIATMLFLRKKNQWGINSDVLVAVPYHSAFLFCSYFCHIRISMFEVSAHSS